MKARQSNRDLSAVLCIRKLSMTATRNVLRKSLYSLTYQVIQENRSIYWQMIVCVIVSKKSSNQNVYVC